MPFLSRGRGYTLFLTDKAEAVLSLSAPQRTPRTQRRTPTLISADSANSAVKSTVLRMHLVGANRGRR